MRATTNSTRWLLLLGALMLGIVTAAVFVVPSNPRADAAATPTVVAAPDRATRTDTPPVAAHSPAARPSQSAVSLDAAMCTAAPAGKWIRVSITKQRAWLCDGRSLRLATPVTTGADVPDRATHVGTWHIQAHQTDRWLGGPGYSVQVRWWMPYDGDFGLHDASFQTFPFGSSLWRTQGSHGCVHFPDAAMALVYDWAPDGTTITIEA